MTWLTLLLAFLQIGFFSIGGGYATIPLIQEQVVERIEDGVIIRVSHGVFLPDEHERLSCRGWGPHKELRVGSHDLLEVALGLVCGFTRKGSGSVLRHEE